MLFPFPATKQKTCSRTKVEIQWESLEDHHSTDQGGVPVGWGHGTGDHTDTRAPQLWPGAPGALVCIGKELCLQVPRPWHFSPNRPGKARADKATERNSLENTENEITVSSGCSDRKVGPPPLILQPLADTKTRVAVEYKLSRTRTLLIQYTFLRESSVPATEDSKMSVTAYLPSENSSKGP